MSQSVKKTLEGSNASAPMPPPGMVFGIPFLTCSMQQALADIDSMIAEQTSDAPKTSGALFCAFINAHCLNLAYLNPGYARILREANRVWADGIGVAIAAKYLKTPVLENVNGTDMLPLLCERGHSLYLFGAAPGIAEQAKKNLEARFPTLRILGADDGFFKDEADEKERIQKINQASPDILLVAMGVPRQEEWIAAHREQLKCRIAIGVGGLLDFASGRIPRAPRWMRRCGLEWVYRLYNEPQRLWRRYIIGNPLFLFRVLIAGRKKIHETK